MFHATFVQIALFNWLRGRHQGLISEKYSKFFFSKTVRRMKLKKSWHTYLGHCLLQKLCFLFRSDKNSGCYGNLKFQ